MIILSGLFIFVYFRKYKRYKANDMKTGNSSKKMKEARNVVIFFSFWLLLASWTVADESMDLVFKDFVTREGIYSHSYRAKEICVNKIFFLVNGEQDHCQAFSKDSKDLEEGARYRYTYAWRTGMLISIEKIE